jgi:predicted Zn finger-like uncharacterized protein
MVVQCSSCLTEFELDPNKVPGAGVRARCSVCAAVIAVPPPPAKTAPAEPASVAASSPPSAGAYDYTPQPESYAASESAIAETAEPDQEASVAAVDEPPAYHAEPAPAQRQSWDAPPAPITPAPIEADAGQRRPINPFLTRDPALRAKRLARALVSDIVAYHPARHAEGLRDGTLKTLFRDEIKKSYEEYVDQVGRDFAGSTTHFQDALNDVLASGKKLF